MAGNACITPGTFPLAGRAEKHRGRLTVSSCSVSLHWLPRSTNALSAGTRDEYSTCAHCWHNIAVLTQELSPADSAMFWHKLL